jgi:hypothetical protein
MGSHKIAVWDVPTRASALTLAITSIAAGSGPVTIANFSAFDASNC